LATAGKPEPFKDSYWISGEKVLTHAPAQSSRALTHAANMYAAKFESEFRPIFMTFTTGRKCRADPLVLYAARHRNFWEPQLAGVVEIARPRRERNRLLNTLPFAPTCLLAAHYAGTEAVA